MSTILIVDDAPINIDILHHLLEQGGYSIRVASNGRQAIHSMEQQLPDLVIMDINMPEMDGFEACSRIKSRIDLWNIPVIFISASSDIESLNRAFQVGGCDYINKPFHPHEVMARVRNQLRLKEVNRQQARIQLYQSMFQLTAGIAHEINTPLGICITASSFIHEAGDQISHAMKEGALGKNMLKLQLDEIQEGAMMVENNLQRVVTLLNRFKTLAQDQAPPKSTRFNPHEVISMLIAGFAEEFQQQHIEMVMVCNTTWLTCPQRLFLDLVQELILNSMAHGAVSPLRLGLTLDEEGDRLRLHYWDNGTGMPLTELPRLFDPFFTTKRGDPRHCGLSASRIHNLVESNLGGSIRAYLPEEGGLHYEICLPLNNDDSFD
ncbi:hybrid sensor histidine kinase/response regulator [Aeromonas australiensis]|uniref:hybrid sensor histidine kinase/response regulator n=1 Tax=Aeromonas australiensis TaxID=1114880 RepID=UPI00058A5598|nr:hybrid sensor histidine kinase/response regulator [Aeromonas australiensis]